MRQEQRISGSTSPASVSIDKEMSAGTIRVCQIINGKAFGNSGTTTKILKSASDVDIRMVTDLINIIEKDGTDSLNSGTLEVRNYWSKL